MYGYWMGRHNGLWGQGGAMDSAPCMDIGCEVGSGNGYRMEVMQAMECGKQGMWEGGHNGLGWI